MIPTFETSTSADRRTYYGASDVGIILGLSGFKSPFELWAEKTGRVARPDLEADPDIRRGRLLEPGILAMLGDVLDAPVQPGPAVHDPAIVRRALSPYAGCHPDGFVLRSPVEGAEVKAPRRGHDWGDTDTDEVPPPYLAQVQVCLALTGLETWHLGALLHGECRVYSFRLDEELVRGMLRTCDDWWTTHVLADVEPPLDGSRAASAVYARRIRGAERPATDVEGEAIRRYAQLGREIKALEADRERIRVELLTAADGRRLTVGTGKGAWGLSLSACAGRTTIDTTRLRAAYPDAHADCVRVGEPYTTVRTFGLGKE